MLLRRRVPDVDPDKHKPRQHGIGNIEGLHTAMRHQGTKSLIATRPLCGDRPSLLYLNEIVLSEIVSKRNIIDESASPKANAPDRDSFIQHMKERV